jgi:hypothetical protein
MDGNWVTPLAIQSNSNVIYAGYAGVYRSTDNGSSWTKISDTIIKSNLSTLAVAPSDPNYIYASTGSSLFVTKNGGASWSTYILSGISINSFAIHPTNPEKLWISSSSTTNRVLVSVNAGASFTNVSSNLPSISARSVVVDNTADEGLYVAMNLGVYYTNKNMTGWVNLTDNLPLVAINEVELQVSGGKIRVGTYGRGAWERAIYSPCGDPSNLATDSISTTNAKLSWTGAAGSVSYNVDFKTTASSTWLSAATGLTQTSYWLGGLAQGTSYDWRVNAVCGSGTSAYSSASFATITPCGTPGSLSTSNVSTTSATLNWSAVAGAIVYNVYYKPSSSGIWNQVSDSVFSNSYVLTGLSEGTTYNWKVSATCIAGTGNEVTSQFTTPITCNAPATVTTSNITTTSASLNWTAVSGATGYDVEYKASSSATWIVKATNLNALTYSLTGLTASTSYDWRVRTNCGTLSGYSSYNQSTAFTTAATPCSDVYESNNSASASKTISFNTEISAAIGTSTDVDWFKFTTPNTTATNLRLSLYNLPANYDLNLYNRSQVVLRSSANTGTTSESIIYNSTAAKTLYYARVIGVGGAFSTTGCYKLKVENSSVPYTSAAPGQPITQSLMAEPVQEFSVFPTPARDFVNITYLSAVAGRGEMIITDATGKMLQSRMVVINEGENNYKLPLRNMSAGVYTLRLLTGDKVITEKLIKN